ncbi:MAG TPA: crosslink repair DNA glycosylase YcaQ family protein [Planctomycetaceae bacterium]|jgi:hypothetical protein
MTNQILTCLRRQAIAQSLFRPGTLKAAIGRLGFVQADPIRSPARAQDLILRHRVKGYRAGDLERRYADLDIEEDILYAYGFLPRTVWRLLHPRMQTGLPALEKKVLAVVGRFGEMHPKDLEAHLGRERVINAWGGYSKATTRALEDLHYRGLLRITRRENGIRIYAAAPPFAESMSAAERLRKLIMVVAKILAPTPEKSLHATIARFRRLGNTRAAVDELLRMGELQKEAADGVTYLWPAGRLDRNEPPRAVRLLAPFDPLVWDRRRFEHFWQWPYRFEAYTPPAKRLRGYYAMPMLWGDLIVGWANVRADGVRLNVDVGYVNKRPRGPVFRSELDAEMARMKAFLSVGS